MKTEKTTRQHNDGLRKRCDCKRRDWPKCSHSWYLNFKPRGGKPFRLSLDKELDRHIDSKSEAKDEAEKLRQAIRAGTFRQTVPALERLTVGQLLDRYQTRYIAVERKDSLTNVGYQIALIKRTEIERPNGRRQPFGAWPVADVTTDTIEQFKATRAIAGLVTTNRDLSLLRALFNWATSKTRKFAIENPFLDGHKAAVTLSKEHPRSRRLEDGEAAPLLAVCGHHLRAVVEAALETGMRLGEILSLQWKQVEGLRVDAQTVTWAPKAELFLPFRKTKTKKDRRIPISTRLKAILEMRRFDPAGEPLPLDSYVFGTAIGTPVLSVTRSWHRAILRAHGYTPVYIKTNLGPESRAALRAINLHFHDLRREAGSRWMDGGVPIATIQRWLGHANVAQTSTYLAGTQTSEHDAMRRYEDGLKLSTNHVQRLGNGFQTEGQTAPSSAATSDSAPNKTGLERETPIM